MSGPRGVAEAPSRAGAERCAMNDERAGDGAADDGTAGETDDGTAGDADGGTYTLLCELAEPASITVGALGEREFAAGWYAYTGSAFGPGGFARVERHRDLAAGERTARHWHVDYLLGHPATRVDAVARTPGADRECAVSDALAAADGAARVDGFGASDCDCPAHLVFAPERETLAAVLAREHAAWA